MQPELIRATKAIHDNVDTGLEGLDVPFDGVLVLLVGFTLPAANLQSPKIDFNTFAVFDCSIVSEKTIGGTVFVYAIF